MTIAIALLLFIIVASMVLFSFEKIPVDVVAIGLLVVLVTTGLLPLDKAFLGFGSDVVVVIFGLLVLTAALLRTGVVEAAGQLVVRKTGKDTSRLLLVILLAASIMSAFISNTAATAFFIPVVLGMSRKAKLSRSKLLMPLAFASILSSSVTLVATSTNIVVSGLMTQYKLPPLGMFELTPVGLPIALIGLGYMYFIGRRLIPERVSAHEGLGDISPTYLTEIILRKGSIFAGKTLAETGLGRDLDLTVVRVIREDQRYLAPQADLALEVGDVLLVEGQRTEILNIKNSAGFDLRSDVAALGPSLQSNEVQLVEGIILLRSSLIGRTLKDVQFRERYGLQVLGINRHGETIHNKISQTTMQLGDVLLIQGNRSNVTALEDDQSFRIIGEVEHSQLRIRQAVIAVAAFLIPLLLAALNVLSLPVAVLLGVLIVFLTKCITPEQAYRDVEWKAIILIGCMLGFGVALEASGTASYLANQIVHWVGDANPLWLLAGFFILTVILTQPMSNQAAAVVVLPIALQAALQVGLNPRTFAIMIAIAASTSYLTPLEPSCLMVYGPGQYKFVDFVKVGSLLTLLIFGLAIWLVPIFWPL
jgi:di/tricarboxylate transporter